mmetsp:Transcript_3098/g.8595  ORF Transcript_3098/g.8595 Transcript_3098/m.8595 type:complete len:80 (+) Transcript_3098:125-364(+)
MQAEGRTWRRKAGGGGGKPHGSKSLDTGGHSLLKMLDDRMMAGRTSAEWPPTSGALLFPRVRFSGMCHVKYVFERRSLW